MKKHIQLCCGLILSLHSISQETLNRNQLKTEVNSSNVVQKIIPDSLQGETIEHLDNCIAAIDVKVEYINSDQTMREAANAENWFEKMAMYRARYVARKELLISLTTDK